MSLPEIRLELTKPKDIEYIPGFSSRRNYRRWMEKQAKKKADKEPLPPLEKILSTINRRAINV